MVTHIFLTLGPKITLSQLSSLLILLARTELTCLSLLYFLPIFFFQNLKKIIAIVLKLLINLEGEKNQEKCMLSSYF